MVDWSLSVSPDPSTADGLADIRSQLRPHSAAVLDYLLLRRGEVVSKSEIMDAVWTDVAVTENSLYQCVAEIRKALGTGTELHLKNVPRRGYVLDHDASVSAVGRLMPKPSLWITGSVICLLAAVMVGLMVLSSKETGTPVVARSDGDGEAAAYISDDAAGASDGRVELPGVSVVAFDNLSEDPRWDRLGQSLGHEISRQLAANNWLQVFTDVDADGVRFQLAGTVHPREDEVHIGAMLTELNTGKLVWAKSWSAKEAEYFNLQAAVAHEAAAELSGHWSGAVVRYDAMNAGRQPTDSLDAYELFLRGTQAKHRFTPEGFEEARQLLTRAVEIDPGFLDAWTTLSVVHNLRALIQTDRTELERILSERTHIVETAVALAPEDPLVLMEQGWLQARNGDHSASLQSVRRAVALAPDNPDVLAYAALNGNLRVDLGDEGVAWIELARQHNPDPPQWYAIAEGLARFTARDWEGSLAVFDTAPDYVTRHLFSAVALAQLDRTAEAREVVERMMTAVPGFRVDYYVYQEGMDPDVNGTLLLETAQALGVPVGGDLRLERASVTASSDRTP